ncbi:hypothetical protein [Rhizobium pisi]|uniref:hypothetical protein n=1 Tax=Rhizobium pisi TaxID=574561 RepID=UPI003D01FDC4
MARTYQKQKNQIHIRSKASGDRSIGVITLKQSATEYGAGTVVVAEYAAGAATGLYVDPVAAGVDVSAYDTVKVAIIHDRIHAADGNQDAVALVRDAEVYGNLISLKNLAGAEKTAVAEALEAAGLITR